MPLYDYRCTECEAVVEVMHGIHDRGPETCAACGGAMRKALSTPAIHFKGSGWAKKDAAAATAKKAKPKAGPSSGSSAPAESKTADGAGSGATAEGSKDASEGKPAKDSSSTTAKQD